jgi:NADPH:quinone reductase-like Zn-dependent oxidoreductase
MRAYHLTGERARLRPVDLPAPAPGPGEVAVDVAAASLNYRDLLVSGGAAGLVPLSDGAGTVAAVGPGVDGGRVGERVVVGFMPGWLDGPLTPERQASALGGGTQGGVLAERVVVPAAAAVPIPDALSFEAAACLPCAGVTAWAALFERRPLCPGETVLLLGTGGVSVLALLLAKRAGARVLITSGSDAKLARAAALGADAGVNYARTPDWDAEVLRLTGGRGADLAVDVGGPATLSRTLRAVRLDGRVSLMGVLTGFGGEVDTAAILSRRITLQGIYVGPVAMLEALVRALGDDDAAPAVDRVVDRVFAFGEAEAAYAALAGAGHFGKLVVRVRP